MKIRCNKCNYEWDTKSKMFLISCPRCGNKVRLIKNIEEKEDGSTGDITGS